jgi:HlyD family type I secretion membrane fusion protein
MRQKIAQAREQILGSEGQFSAQRKQLESIRAELTGLHDLFLRGYVPRQRILELERSAVAFEGQASETAAAIVTLKQSVQELELQIEQLHADRIAEVARELREAQVKLLDIRPRLHVARQVLERTAVRSPATGTVVGLTVFTIGGVIAAGERVMEIVPDHGDISVEATIGVDDQKDLHAGMIAEVRLIAYKQRSPPIVKAAVVHVSPDRLTDERTGAPYYVARLEVTRAELERMEGIRLIPGMPVLVIIPTGARTALDYLLRPLSDSFVRSFREK